MRYTQLIELIKMNFTHLITTNCKLYKFLCLKIIVMHKNYLTEEVEITKCIEEAGADTNGTDNKIQELSQEPIVIKRY